MTSAIPWTAPPAPVAHGLLNMPATDLCGFLMTALMVIAALCVLPGELRLSIKALWGPVGAFFSAFHAPLAVGLWGWVVLGVLRPFRGLLGAVKDLTLVVEQLLRLGYIGYRRPVLT